MADRAVFFAAYEMYQKAGSKKKMAMARAQFPTMEDIFIYDYEVGDKITIHCWFVDTVAIGYREL